jgi:protocatechuate 3,4-dioxygenase beta subunit
VRSARRQGRGHRLRTAGIRLAVALSAFVALTGCADIASIDAIGEPIIVQGDVVDDAGRPAKGVEVTLTVHDFEDAVVVAPVIWQASTMTDDDGRYVFRGLPAGEILAFVEDEAVVDFDLVAVHIERRLTGAWAFSRELDGASWAGEAPAYQIPLSP